MNRRTFAWCLIIGSSIMAPVSKFTFAASEPVTVLILSWAAILLTGIDILFTAQVKEKGTEK
jgi:hypothetical protein